MASWRSALLCLLLATLGSSAPIVVMADGLASGPDSTAMDDMPADRVFTTVKEVRAGSFPVVHTASKRVVPGLKETYEVSAPFKWNHRKGAVNCFVGSPAAISRGEAEAIFSGPNGERLDQLNWRRAGEGHRPPSRQWIHEVILGSRTKLIPSPDQLQWINAHRECVEETYVMDSAGDWVWRCETWGQPTSYTHNISLRMRLRGGTRDVYSLVCAKESDDNSDFITWGEVKAHLQSSLAVRF